ncbi:hypothetical protein Q8A73_012766 [Channa argus]|nr:hypothetical protein Q8A73_012766 [Channa argus]
MVATKAKTGMTQYMRDKPTKWGLNLFALPDSSNGYTVDFNVYWGKSQTSSEHGLAYEAVMKLIQPALLGTGYHVYMDNFYTSPKLFMDLHDVKYGACGTYRENRRGCTKGRENAISKKSDRGTIRWIREGPLIFVKWMDRCLCALPSTQHNVEKQPAGE